MMPYEQICFDAIMAAKGSLTQRLVSALLDVVDWENYEEADGELILFTEDPSQAECKAYELCKMFSELHPSVKTKIRENEDSIKVTY